MRKFFDAGSARAQTRTARVSHGVRNWLILIAIVVIGVIGLALEQSLLFLAGRFDHARERS